MKQSNLNLSSNPFYNKLKSRSYLATISCDVLRIMLNYKDPFQDTLVAMLCTFISCYSVTWGNITSCDQHLIFTCITSGNSTTDFNFYLITSHCQHTINSLRDSRGEVLLCWQLHNNWCCAGLQATRKWKFCRLQLLYVWVGIVVKAWFDLNNILTLRLL